MTILHGAEQYSALPFPMPFAAIAAPLGSPAGRHARARGRAGGCEECGELGVAIADGISAFLLGHDMVQPFLRL